MKIGLDLHGVITDMPDFFRELSKVLTDAGWQVHILTGGTIDKAKEELSELGFYNAIHYEKIFSIMDHLLISGVEQTGFNEEFQTPEFDDIDWDRAKAIYCKCFKIDLMIDDSLAYKEFFITPFARLWTNTNTPKINKPKRHLD